MKNTGSQPQESKPKVIVVMPAYNAAKTLRITYDAIPKDNIDHVILVDDRSKDETLKIGQRTEARGLRSRAELWLWRESENLLYRGFEGGCRNYRHAPPRLSI